MSLDKRFIDADKYFQQFLRDRLAMQNNLIGRFATDVPNPPLTYGILHIHMRHVQDRSKCQRGNDYT